LRAGARRGANTSRLYFTVWCTIKEPPPFCQAYGALVFTLSAHVLHVDNPSMVHHTLFYMVKYSDPQLNRTFAALVDQTRRAILDRLEREDGVSISELAKPFAITLPGVMKHLDVLEDAGLITRWKQGRTVTVRLRPDPMRSPLDWLRRYEHFWSPRLDRLAKYAESEEAKTSRKGR
jgi:DNA-binding transcriptional ArsR family regulator